MYIYNLLGKSYHFTALGISNYSACDKFPHGDLQHTPFKCSNATTMPGMMMRNKGRKPGKHLGFHAFLETCLRNIQKSTRIHLKRVESYNGFIRKVLGTLCLLKVSKVFTLVGVSNPSSIAMLHTVRLKQSRKSWSSLVQPMRLGTWQASAVDFSDEDCNTPTKMANIGINSVAASYVCIYVELILPTGAFVCPRSQNTCRV